jgi:hypothetical protein
MRFKIYVPIVFVMVFMLFSFISATSQTKYTLDQIQLLLKEKASRTPAQQKITSDLLQASRESRGQKMAAGVNLLPANVNADAKLDVEVDITCTVNNNLINKITSLGGIVENFFPQYNSIRAKVNLSAIETIAAFADVKAVAPAALYQTVGSGFKNMPVANKISNTFFSFSNATTTNTVAQSAVSNKTEREERVKGKVNDYLKNHNYFKSNFIGAVTSEGDRTHRADDVRNVYSYAGQGIKIGVLSDSYNSTGGEAADILNGDLPGPGNPFGNTTPVTIVQEGGTDDEGRAMLQIVHDLAPKAQLFFATGNGGPGNFANNILQLRNIYHCDIIIDDLSYLNETVFEDGTVAQAVNTVTASGCLYFSSAANSGSVLRNSSGVWEGDFNDAGSLPFTGTTKSGSIHNFGTISSPVDGDIITASSTQNLFYTLTWSDKSGSSANDYDLFLVSSAGVVKGSSTTTQNGTGTPYEQIAIPALVAGDRLVVFKDSSSQVRAFSINTNRGKLTVGTTGQTHGHASCVDAFCVAATPAAGSADGTFPGPYPNAFVNTNRVEYFSSDGPRKMFYNPNGTAITPGNFLFGTNGGTTRQKPDITAADGVVTTLPASSSLNPFYGTSAAAPHAGAIAALLLSARPGLTPAQIRTALTSTALDIEGPGYDINSGYGILQAFQAMQSIMPPLLSNVNLGTVTVTEGTFSNGSGALDPGEFGVLVAQLKNPSLATATNITAVLTTTTSGVTITQNTATYGDITASGTASNTAAPYKIIVNASHACGDILKFNLTVSFGGGGQTPQVFPFTVRLGSVAPTISGKIGQAPTNGAGYTATSGTQTDRVNRNTVGMVSSCASPLAAPGLIGDGAGRQYHAYKFVNNNATAQCVTVKVTSPNFASIFTVAYNNAGFDPSNPNTNFLADAGNSFASQTFSFTAPAAQAFTIVVHDVAAGAASGSAYALDVSLTNCAPGPCTQVVVAPATIAIGTTGSAYTQLFSATGGSGLYTFALTGTLPAGLSFTGNTLSGTPTQGGTFPVTVSVTDGAGCPTGTKSYNLIINVPVGPPAAITATAGTPQTTLPSTTFTTGLQAKVTDASGLAISGASVIFTAPSTGASGTFPGSSLTATSITDANGFATAPAFTANVILGSYNVVATTTGVATSANFALSNATVPCVLTCPANISVNNTTGQCGAIVNYSAPTSSGTCGAVVTTPASGSFFPVGTTTVNVVSGSSTCSFTVTVNDTQAPVFTCPSDITKNTDANSCTALVSFTLPTATDNCSGTNVVASPASGSSFAIGTTPVTVTATDVAGNKSTCTFNVTIVDSNLPSISSQPAATAVCVGITASFSVTATNALSYQWQVNSTGTFININGATAASYTTDVLSNSDNNKQYRVIVKGSCTNIISNAGILTVNPGPAVTLAVTPSENIMPGVPSSLKTTVGASGNYSYLYKKDGVVFSSFTTASIPLTVDDLGTYQVIVTDMATGCVGTSNTVTVSAAASSLLFISPNPNNGIFKVRYYNPPSTSTTRSINVYNSVGARVLSRKYQTTGAYESMDVNISNFSAGVYLVELRDMNGKRIATGKIIKK